MITNDYLKNRFYDIFNRKTPLFFSVSGRTELCGNHTDHQHGRVLTASVDMKIYAAARGRNDLAVNIYSEGYGLITLDLGDTAPIPEEKGSSAALIRGVAAYLADHGFSPTGFDAYIDSEIPEGSGVSSSAAFEILVGRILVTLSDIRAVADPTPSSDTGAAADPLTSSASGIFSDELSVLLAHAGQFAENVYYVKPCGLMDQMACSLEGIIAIDFADPGVPRYERLNYDFEKAGYRLCIIPCGGSHSDLTDEYAAIPLELSQICHELGCEYLSEVSEENFYDRLPQLRQKCGDRAVLRAIHVFEENKRVDRQVNALKNNDIDTYLKLVNESGHSSYELLQNVIPAGNIHHQEMALALALMRRKLKGRGACRIHGGGFAGTIQAYIPVDMDFDGNLGI